MASEKTLRTSELAELVGVKKNTVAKWRQVHDDFPNFVHGTPNFPLYRERDFMNWYIAKWPQRADTITRWVHRFKIGPTGSEHELLVSRPAAEALAYMRVLRDFQYQDWKVTTSSMGFVAKKDGTTHVVAVDTKDPEDWFVYETRILNARREK